MDDPKWTLRPPRCDDDHWRFFYGEAEIFGVKNADEKLAHKILEKMKREYAELPLHYLSDHAAP